MDAAAKLIDLLGLEPHPEGGFYRQTHRAAAGAGGRAMSTAIYFLVTHDAPSCLHRVDADEIFHHYTGDAVEQLVVDADGSADVRWLGTDWSAGQRPQALVAAGTWQGCHVPDPGGWALLGCTVAPGFEFTGFDLADDTTLDALARAVPQHPALLERLRPVTR